MLQQSLLVVGAQEAEWVELLVGSIHGSSLVSVGNTYCICSLAVYVYVYVLFDTGVGD